MSLRLTEVTRRYGDVVALNRVSLDLEPGITALVGPNAAGKSSLMRVATGHVRPTTGQVHAFGQSVWDNPDVMRRLGFVPEQDAFYEFMTGPDFVATLGELHGMSRQQARSRAEEELEALGLTEGWDKPIKTYSKGMRQRVKLAQALMHEPELLLLDEPLLGCDPVARRRIQDRILSLRSAGCTVLVSTHILPEVERLTRDVAFLTGGRLIARGSANGLRDALTQVPSRIRVHCSEPRQAAAQAVTWPEVVSVSVGSHGMDVETSRMRDLLARLHGRTTWGLQGFETLDADLDSLFSYLEGA